MAQLESHQWLLIPLAVALLMLIVAYQSQSSELVVWVGSEVHLGRFELSSAAVGGGRQRDRSFEAPGWANEGRLVVVTSSDIRYAMVLMNFFVFQLDVFTKLDVRIVCLDRPFKLWLERHGGECESYSADQPDSIRAVWHLRARSVSKLLHEGHDVLMSDSDAVWCRNPLPFLGPEYGDIVAQPGTYPYPVREKLGATAVMGFILLRSRDSVVRFFDDFALHAKDDQIGFNSGFLQGTTRPISGHIKQTLRHERREFHTIQYERAIQENSNNVSAFNVTFLSHIKFRRANCGG